jgi:hypothetical protein
MRHKVVVAGWFLLAMAVFAGAAFVLLAPPDANACRNNCPDNGRIG